MVSLLAQSEHTELGKQKAGSGGHEAVWVPRARILGCLSLALVHRQEGPLRAMDTLLEEVALSLPQRGIHVERKVGNKGFQTGLHCKRNNLNG